MAGKKVLVLGAGLVSRPLVGYLLEQGGFDVTVASRTVSKAEALVNGHENGEALSLDVSNEEDLEKLITRCDLAVSLLPYTYHVKVAKLCIKHQKSMVTTSYVSDLMQALDREARDNGVLLLNETGLDPGIDHMSAMRIIDKVKSEGGAIKGFTSYCGGLPAPDDNDNPFGYKFSWSPKGVLMAGRNPGLYLKDGKEVHVPGKELFGSCWETDIPGAGKFEAYPNRNSIPYINLYGLDGIRNMLRGTLRNKGWCRTLKAITDLGLLDDEESKHYEGQSLVDFLAAKSGLVLSSNPREQVAGRLGLSINDEVVSNLDWLGLFTADPVGIESGTSLDVLCSLMLKKMSYKEGEKDMIVLHHEFDVEEGTGKGKVVTSTLIAYGIPGGDSAMARTVSLPAAIASRLILEEKIELKGVHIPVVHEIYGPVLDELSRLGIDCRETEV
ncbi:MAG: saccharopine dehydrogenase [Deltaproteobacteria bacterium]|nr:saccharopine dehydrogenase [Deltaproteobacteria bacterium]